ncbi:MAG: 3'-5' exonuclease [Candidatus Yonathbacteria bacterium]|nr:3'-5' exonuclease [Candidatus Yonathbacteria bacterium]
MIVVDAEMSGTNPYKHSLVSIGAVDFAHPERQFYGECRIWDGAETNPESLAINGFTEEQCRDKNKKSETELIKEFYEWIQPITNKTLAGHNVSFDMDFLNEAFRRASIEWKFMYRVLDIHSIVYAKFIKEGREVPLKFDQSALSLGKILTSLGLPEEPKPHIALNGAKYEAEAFSRIINGKNLLPEFAQYPVEIPEQGKLI